MIKYAVLTCFLMLLTFPVRAAITIPLTVNLSEIVTVTGTPRIAVDVGGTTRYATYTSGTGTNTLTFTLSPQAGDVDLDGVTVSSPIDLNGGTIKDAKGNNAVLTFTPPSTSNVKVNYPSLSLDFIYDADGRYTLNGTAYNDLSSFLTAASGSFTRASIGTYYDSTGTLQTAASGVPRFDYDPVTHTAQGLLIEESRTNSLVRSSEFDNASWSKANTSVIANTATAPDGTLSAEKIIESSANSQHYWYQSYTYVSGTTYTHSVFAKASEKSLVSIYLSTAAFGASGAGTGIYNLSTGTASIIGTSVTGGIVPVGNGWYRCWISKQATASSSTVLYMAFSNLNTYTGDGTSGLYVWGAQVEVGAFPTSYIPTTTATVTRANELLSIPTGGWFSLPQSTLFLQATAFGVESFGRFGSGFGASSNDYFGFPYVSTTGVPHALYYRSGGAGPVLNGTPTLSFNTLYKTAGSYSVPDNVASYAKNGAIPATGSGVSAMASATTLYVGTAPFNSSSATSGYYQKLKYYPARVTDTQLQLLTQ